MPLQNQAIYLAAFAGAVAGMSSSNRIPISALPATYAETCAIAGAFATQLDLVFGMSAPTSIDTLVLQSVCESIWYQRTPHYEAQNILPITYLKECQAVVAILNAADTYLGDQGISPNLPSGGGALPGGGYSVPAPVNILGAVVVENPANTRVVQRLRQSMIDPNFSISSFTKDQPNGAQLLYRRSATPLSGPLHVHAVYPFAIASATVDEAFSVGPQGTWSEDGGGAHTDFTRQGANLAVLGTDGGVDPTLAITLHAHPGNGDVAEYLATTTLVWTSDIYFGTTVGSALLGTDVFSGGALIGTFLASLQRTRAFTHTFVQSNTYAWVLWPDRAPYTATNPTFRDQSGFTYVMVDMGTVPIVREGVTQTYRVRRSAAALTGSFDVTCT